MKSTFICPTCRLVDDVAHDGAQLILCTNCGQRVFDPSNARSTTKGWIGVDFDGVLAEAGEWKGDNHLGAPIPAMVERVKRILDDGADVRIFTARVGVSNQFSAVSKCWSTVEFAERQRKLIEDWCEKHIGVRLPVTAEKDFAMERMYDDRALQVVVNEGTLVGWTPEGIRFACPNCKGRVSFMPDHPDDNLMFQHDGYGPFKLVAARCPHCSYEQNLGLR